MFRHGLALSLPGALALALCISPHAFAQMSKEEIEEQEYSPEVQQFPEDPNAGFVMMDEGLWVTLSDQPQQEFESAVQALESGDPRAAATSIRKAAAFIRLAGGHSLPATRALLYSDLKDLVSLAHGAQAGRVTTRDQVAPVFARALEALAEHHAARAEQSWQSRKAKPTGKDLDAAVQDLRWSSQWARVPGTTRRERAMAEAEATGELLSHKLGLDDPEVAPRIARFVTELRMYRGELDPPAKSAPDPD